MKRTIIATVALLLSSILPTFAAEPVPVKPVVWGIKGNLGAELPSHWKSAGFNEKMYNNGFGASLGGVANIYLGKNFYFEPELALFYTGYSYDIVTQVAPNSPYVNVGPSIHKVGVRVPLNFGYFINISDTWGLTVFTGPELSYAFWGNAKSSDEETNENYNLTHIFSGDYAQRRFDLGWKIGVGFPVQNFIISLEGDLGITNMLRQYHTFCENRVSLGIAYYFPVPVAPAD